MLVTGVARKDHAGAAAAAPVRVRNPQIQAPQWTYTLWQGTVWFDPEAGQPLTTARCQELVDFLQSDRAFLALRFPLVGGNQPGDNAYSPPVAMRPDYWPQLVLHDLSGGTEVLNTTLEYKTQHFGFLENYLPQAEGEHWLALGPPTEPALQCPADLNSETWNWQLDFWLEFDGNPATCAGCSLQQYFCYEGEEPPPPFVQAPTSPAGSANSPAFQEQGITCLGPQPLVLDDPAVLSLRISEAHSENADPGDQVIFSHFVGNRSAAPMQVTLTFSSTQDLPWGLYAAELWDQPDLLAPITAPFTLAAGEEKLLTAVLDVPAGSAGVETLYLTATSADDPPLSSTTTDLLWVGDWTPPPPPPATYTPTAAPTATQTPPPPPSGLYLPWLLR